VSIAVVVSAATYCLKQIIPVLRLRKNIDYLQKILKYDTYVLKTLQKIKALPKIRFNFLKLFLFRHAKLRNITLAALYFKSKPPGWPRPPLYIDCNLVIPGFPNPSVLTRPSHGGGITWNLLAIAATDLLLSLCSRLSCQLIYFTHISLNPRSNNSLNFIQKFAGFFITFPGKKRSSSFQDDWLFQEQYGKRIWQIGKKVDSHLVARG
jgi:hypothetical protein